MTPEKVLEFVRKYSYGFWLGFAMNAFFGLNAFDWQFWATIVPTFILVQWAYDNKKEGE